MGVVESLCARDRKEFDQWVRAKNATITVADENWEWVTLEAHAHQPSGVQQRCRYTYRLPLGVALRRLHNTFVVGVEHTAPHGGRCLHVRVVRPGFASDTESAAEQHAILIASALVALERHTVCGATSANLTPYVVTKALDWRG